ncbi:hypothetical protein GAP32_398A [Cronobacter phage vB_CsaM_GAP32]|uniref:Putative membrane protein n=1 Tax=Cronobacter phage vB_CsaM_GAP32 TaxID=1141136 RepID=K4F6F2_9CAUD|nr:hypothetical protein GAP32_398A [Cronobacter phage vB_CsaM_GAP32]AFC21851.1 putative membrane protein [Cronobacter phage vB_CsaM_GAP32]
MYYLKYTVKSKIRFYLMILYYVTRNIMIVVNHFVVQWTRKEKYILPTMPMLVLIHGNTYFPKKL